MNTRNVSEEDYLKVIEVLDDWWGGRPMTGLLPRLFFEHFQPTSFVVEDNGDDIVHVRWVKLNCLSYGSE